MRSYIFIILALLALHGKGLAQAGTAYDMTVDNVKVIVQPSGNDIVTIQTVIRGGVQNYAASEAGIESLAMRALTECGTARDTKNSFKDKLDRVNAQVYGNSGMDFATFSLNCIKGDLDSVWPLYVDALTTPAFDETQFARIRQDAVNNLKAMESRPDFSIRKLSLETAFAGKDYAKSPAGSGQTVSALTAARTKAYYQSILTRRRMVIVVVGDLDRDVLTKKITQLLQPIPEGQPFTPRKESYNPTRNTFTGEKKELATNYIVAVSGGPAPGSPDYNAFTLAMRIFYDRTFLEVRTNNGLSYAPYSYFSGGLTPYSGVGVSTTEPNRYIGVMRTLVDKTKQDGFTDEELRNMKTTYLTSFYYRQETNDAQAASLASDEVLHNNWRRSLTLNDDLKKVSVQDIDRVFNKYVTNFTWVYQGDTSKVNPVLYTEKEAKPKEKLPASSVTGAKNN